MTATGWLIWGHFAVSIFIVLSGYCSDPAAGAPWPRHFPYMAISQTPRDSNSPALLLILLTHRDPRRHLHRPQDRHPLGRHPPVHPIFHRPRSSADSGIRHEHQPRLLVHRRGMQNLSAIPAAPLLFRALRRPPVCRRRNVRVPRSSLRGPPYHLFQPQRAIPRTVLRRSRRRLHRELVAAVLVPPATIELLDALPHRRRPGILHSLSQDSASRRSASSR